MTESGNNTDELATFFNAVRSGDVALVVQALDAQPEWVHAREDGATPLHYAAWDDRADVAQQLVERGADLNAVDTRHGMLPIAWANEHGHMQMVQALAAWGADVPFQLAAAFGLIDRVRETLATNPDAVNQSFNYGTALQYAAIWGQVGVVSLLLESGADFAVRDEHGQTPLSAARAQTTDRARREMLAVDRRRDQIQAGCAEVVRLLEAAGALT